MTPENEEKMVVARRYLDLREAEFAMSVLHGHDVDAFIDVPYTASMFPQYMFGSSGVSLLVRESDLDEAIKLLDDPQGVPDETT